MNTRETPKSTPICASFASILPVLDEPATDEREAAEAQAHLATCPYCQARVADYYRLDTAMRRSLNPSGTPHPRTEDIMSKLLYDSGSDQPATKTVTPLRLPPHEPRPGRVRRFFSGLGAFAAVLVIVLIAVTLFSRHPSRPGPTGSQTPLQVTQAALNDVAMVSPTEGWAVGYTSTATVRKNHQGDLQKQGLLMHYSDGVWTSVPVAIQGYWVELTAISMLSPTDGWAAGFQQIAGQPSRSIILHYDGQSWKPVAGSFPGGFAHLQMLSDTDGWAIGGASMSNLYHYDGHTWTEQPFPASLEDGTQNAVSVSDLFMLSSTEGWAVGSISKIQSSSETNQPDLPSAMILHYTGGQWTVADTIPNATLGHIALASSSEGWATGSTLTVTQGQATPSPIPVTSHNQAPLLLHYANGKWTILTNPIDSETQYNGIFLNAPDAWIIGVEKNAPNGPNLVHYNGTDWAKVKLPAIRLSDEYNIDSLSMLSPTEGWAVGWLTNPDKGIGGSNGYDYTPSQEPLILHDHNGVWSVVMS